MRALLRVVTGRLAFFVAIGLGCAVVYMLPEQLPTAKRLLIAWCLGTVFFIAFASWRLARCSTAEFRSRVESLDDGAVTILVFSLGATLASFAAVVVEMSAVKNIPVEGRSVALGLMAATLICSWLFVPTIFALHYAHVFYARRNPAHGSLDFGGETEPDYWDFIYFAVAIGASAATSDVNLRSRLMRRLVAVHSVFAFFFNAMVLALGINIAAGLLSG